MRVLALDTTTRAGSVAVVEGDRIVVERAGDPTRSHAERLPAELVSVLQDTGLALRAVDVFAVAVGPGSFTGLRVGIATIQGLAFVQHRNVVPVVALEALAHAGSGALPVGARVGAWMDAHRHEVFSALYQIVDAPLFARDRLVELEPPAVGDPAATIERWSTESPVDVCIGDGATLYGEIIGARCRVVPAPLLAGTIGLIAAACARDGKSVGPAGVHPLYVRRPDVEVDRERKIVLGR